MTIGFGAHWWALDQVAIWIALRHSPFVDAAGSEDICFADLVPEPAPLDEEAEIFAAAANPPGLDVPLAASPLLQEVRVALGGAHVEALDCDLRRRLPGYTGLITLQQVLDILVMDLASGQLSSAGQIGPEPTHRGIRSEEWLSLRVRRRPALAVVSVDGVGVSDIRCRRADVLARYPELPRAGELPSAAPRSRAKNSSPYRESDLLLVEEMKELLRTRKAVTVHAAATAMAYKAQGSPEIQSRVTRLVRLYKQTSRPR